MTTPFTFTSASPRLPSVPRQADIPVFVVGGTSLSDEAGGRRGASNPIGLQVERGKYIRGTPKIVTKITSNLVKARLLCVTENIPDTGRVIRSSSSFDREEKEHKEESKVRASYFPKIDVQKTHKSAFVPQSPLGKHFPKIPSNPGWR